MQDDNLAASPGSDAASPGVATWPDAPTARWGSDRWIRAPMATKLVHEEQPVLEHLLEDEDRFPTPASRPRRR